MHDGAQESGVYALNQTGVKHRGAGNRYFRSLLIPLLLTVTVMFHGKTGPDGAALGQDSGVEAQEPATGEKVSEGPVWSVVTFLPGDSLESIAARFGVPVQMLQFWNPQLSGEPEIGARVRVLSTHREEERFRYRFWVPAGTSLQQIAQQYQLPLEVLLKLNNLRRIRRLKSRQRLVVYVKRSAWPGGYLDGGIQLTDTPGILVKHPCWAWGRPVSVRTLEQVGRELARAFPGSLLVVGDLALEQGGKFPPHKGHRQGYDVDFGIFRGGENYRIRFKPVKVEDLDVERTWFVLSRLLETGRVARILVDYQLQGALRAEAVRQGVPDSQLEKYFQFPRPRFSDEGIIRHWPGHQNHIHVRFQEVEGEVLL